MKIYTKTGDGGTTALFGGERVPKHDARVGAYGSVDEANAALGVARALLEEREIDELLAEVQNDLFGVGADLATPLAATARQQIVPMAEADVARLERRIDRYAGELEPLKNFILPGGHASSAAVQHARAIVRRAEREVAALLDAEPEAVNPQVLIYLNRLSDLLFTLARYLNMRAGVAESRWHVKSRRRPD